MGNIFILGYLGGISQNSPKPVIFEARKQHILSSNNASIEVDKSGGKNFVASKSGTKVYFVWCTGVGRIKAENKVFFDTLDDALKKGYKPASNCPGM